VQQHVPHQREDPADDRGDADAQIDTTLGLPSASGSNSLVLNGTSYFADNFAQANQIDILKAAFKASGS
jgi:hypothetical protein